MLKYCHLRQDAFGDDIALHYVRDKSKREVDFLVTWNGEPWLLAEAARSHRHSLTNLAYFARKLNVTQTYLVTLEDQRHYIDKRTGIRVIPANTFLTAFV